MKFKKLFSAAAAAMIAASAIAIPASANWEKDIEGLTDTVSAGSSLYMIRVFNKDEFNGDGTPLIDHGLDLAKIGYVSFTMEVNEEDREFFDGQFGGGVGSSIHAWEAMPGVPLGKPSKPKESKYDTAEEYEAAVAIYDKQMELFEARKAAGEAFEAQGPLETKTTPAGTESTIWNYYNWDCSYQYWGVIDHDGKDPMSYDIDGEYLEGLATYINYFDPEATAFLETLAPYTYRIKTPLANPVVDGYCTADDIDTYRVYLQTWGGSSSLFKLTITRSVIYDLDGKAMIAFDKQGNEVPVTDDDNKEPVKPEAFPVFRPAVDASITDTATRDIVKEIMVHDPSFALDEFAGMTITSAEKTSDAISFDISFTSGDAPIQPSGNVTVKVPVPEFLGSTINVYHYDADGKANLLTSEIKNGYVVFETDSFSKFTLTNTTIDTTAATEEPTGLAESTTTSNTTSTTSDKSSGLPMPALIGIIAGAVVIVAVVVIVVVKKKKA